MKYSTQEEVWKDVIGYEGTYKISSYGKLISLDRITNTGRKLKGKRIKTKITKGYHQVTLHKDGERKMVMLSRLVAEHFIPGSNRTMQVNHIDENKNNNNVTNLEWVKPKQNANHGTRNERISDWVSANSKKSAVIMLDKKDNTVIKKFESINKAYDYLGKELNGNISYACNGKAKSAYGYKWEYR